jgi:hypothetical protein
LNEQRYSGTAKSTTQTLNKEVDRHPNGLALETSRGENVRHNHVQFPEERPSKRQKLEPPSKPNVPKPLPMSQAMGIDPDSDLDIPVEVRRSGSAARSSKTPSVQITRPRQRETWLVSGAQDSQRVDAILDRSRTRDPTHGQDTPMSRRSHGQNMTRAQPNPSRPNEVVNISDDEQPTKIQQAAARPRGRPPKRAAEIHADPGKSAPRKKHDPNTVLSPYFQYKPRKPIRMADPGEVIEVDDTPTRTARSLYEMMEQDSAQHEFADRDRKQERTEACQSVEDSADELVSDEEPSPRESTPKKQFPRKIPITKEDEKPDQSDEEDELHGGIPPSFRNGKSIANQPSGPIERRSKRQTKSKSGWLVEQLIEPNGDVHDAWNFLELDIHVGKVSKYLILSNPKSLKEGNEMVLDLGHIRGIQWSRDSDCAILRIECPGNDKPVYDIKFHDHDEVVDFAERLNNWTALRPNNDKRPKYFYSSPLDFDTL